jgi:hypothetical protein
VEIEDLDSVSCGFLKFQKLAVSFLDSSLILLVLDLKLVEIDNYL